MPNIYFENDNGDAIIYDGNAYESIGISVGIPDDNSLIEYSNITSIIFNIADDQGKSEYTAGEHALALYEYGCSGIPITFSPGTHILFTAPTSGVFRFWRSGSMDAWYVNGIQQTRPDSNGNEIYGQPVNVVSGDIITVYENQFIWDAYYSFLPFVN